MLLDQDLRLVIADFGSAAKCRTEDNKEIEFDSAIVVGSQEYNAPEINMEKLYLGEKADLFSAGICLFLMVMGCAPFREDSFRDPYFHQLSKKEKSAYWAIYGETKVSDEFKGISSAHPQTSSKSWPSPTWPSDSTSPKFRLTRG